MGNDKKVVIGGCFVTALSSDDLMAFEDTQTSSAEVDAKMMLAGQKADRTLDEKLAKMEPLCAKRR